MTHKPRRGGIVGSQTFEGGAGSAHALSKCPNSRRRHLAGGKIGMVNRRQDAGAPGAVRFMVRIKLINYVALQVQIWLNQAAQ